MSEDVSSNARNVRKHALKKVIDQIEIFDHLDEVCFIDQEHLSQCEDDLLDIINSIKIRDIEKDKKENDNAKRRKK